MEENEDLALLLLPLPLLSLLELCVQCAVNVVTLGLNVIVVEVAAQ